MVEAKRTECEKLRSNLATEAKNAEKPWINAHATQNCVPSIACSAPGQTGMNVARVVLQANKTEQKVSKFNLTTEARNAVKHLMFVPAIPSPVLVSILFAKFLTQLHVPY